MMMVIITVPLPKINVSVAAFAKSFMKERYVYVYDDGNDEDTCFSQTSVTNEFDDFWKAKLLSLPT